MDVNKPGQQSKERDLQRQHPEQASDCSPAPLLSFWSAPCCLLGAFSHWKACLLLSVFVSASLLHVPLLVPPLLLLENRDSPLAIRPHAVWIASRKLLSGYCLGQARSQGA